MRILLLGGSKSGKSMLGQRLARQLADGGPMIYWATLEPRDGEDRAIVRRHLAEREGWGFQTLERGRELPRGLAAVPPEQRQGLLSVLANDPRPRYQDDPQRVYGMAYGGRNVRFRVEGDVLTVLGVEERL